MYGTVMVGRLAASLDEVITALKDWENERQVRGFVDASILLCDDGRTIVNTVRFESKEAYTELADDPEQDRWWRERMRPLLEEEPTWYDGTWYDRAQMLPPQPVAPA